MWGHRSVVGLFSRARERLLNIAQFAHNGLCSLAGVGFADNLLNEAFDPRLACSILANDEASTHGCFLPTRGTKCCKNDFPEANSLHRIKMGTQIKRVDMSVWAFENQHTSLIMHQKSAQLRHPPFSCRHAGCCKRTSENSSSTHSGE